MKKVGVLMFILFLLVGCKKRESDFLSSVNAVKIRFGEEVISTINDPRYVSQIVDILSTAKKGKLVREDSYVLSDTLVYEFYENNQVVYTVLFNGEDTMRVFDGGLCFEMEYEGISLADWYEMVNLP